MSKFDERQAIATIVSRTGLTASRARQAYRNTNSIDDAVKLLKGEDTRLAPPMLAPIYRGKPIELEGADDYLEDEILESKSSVLVPVVLVSAITLTLTFMLIYALTN